MNPKIRRTYEDIERSKRKVAELNEHIRDQELRVKVLENEEIARRLRLITSDPRELAELLVSIEKTSKAEARAAAKQIKTDTNSTNPIATDNKKQKNPNQDTETKNDETK